MKRLWLCAAAAGALAATSANAGAPIRNTLNGYEPIFPAASAEVAAGAGLDAARYGAWGLDLAGRDTSVRPGDDFNRYANGRAIDAMVIPADRSRFGSFDRLTELSEARVRAILDSTSANPAAATGEEQQVGAFYHSFMDEARIEQLDAAPLQADLARIRAAATREQLAAIMGGSTDDFNGTILGAFINTDAKDPQHYAVYLTQSGLSLPDRDYYLNDDFKAQREAYQAYIARMLGMAGWANPEAGAKAVLDFETEIAKVSWTLAERRQADKTYNASTVADLDRTMPGFPWKAYLTAAHLGSVNRVVVREPTAMAKIAALFASTPIETLQAWQAFSLVDNASPYLSQRFAQANFEFHGKTLSGQQEQKARWKRAAAVVDGGLGEAIGKIYVSRYFPAESKAKMEQLVADLRVALQHRIENLTWMSPETKAQALDKLSKFSVKIGYPSKWRDYSGLRMDQADLYGNVERAAAFDWARRVARLNGPVDRTEWGMTPQTVNAYYSQTQNEIVFPAAILQPPFFDPHADMAVNYGGIGGVIGHEMTHGFDDQGRKSDGTGALRDWWTADDAAKFQAQAARLGAQYEAFDIPGADGIHIKGAQTMGENIADLGGVHLGLDAYHASLHGKPAPVIDGLTGDQRVFLGWAQVWRAKFKPDALKRQLASDPHSPAMVRAVGPLRNVDEWYAAFDVKPGDKEYVAPENRVRIW